MRGRRRDERGAVALLVAASLAGLLVVTAMVLDFGLVRLDRQQVKLAADSAVMAGLQAADGDTSEVYTQRAVCQALEFLKANHSELSGLPAGSCATPDPNVVCEPTVPATFASYTGTTTSAGVTSTVTIKSPYDLDEGNFPEESYASVAGDDSTNDGCDQVGIVVTQSREPGLGSLATSGDLVIRIRSVGRVLSGDGDIAPALLLLERTACSVLTVGAAGGGADTHIWVSGTGETPGTIHTDSAATGADCGSGSNQQLFQGKQANGIVAYGGSTGATGRITSVAGLNGVPSGIVYDAAANVYGTTAVGYGGAGTATPPTGRSQVTRGPVDERYRLGVLARIADASTATASWGLSSAPSGWVSVGCNPTAAEKAALAALPSTASVFVGCTNSGGFAMDGVIGAGTVYFRGFVKNGNLRMPNATTVYINNGSGSGGQNNASALNLSTTGGGFCMRAAACTSAPVTQCPSSTTAARGRLFVRRGRIDAQGGVLRLCNTTVFMLGGQTTTGCVPGTDATPPTATPCAGTAGTGQVSVAGGAVQDWTAPNQYDADILTLTKAQRQAAWDQQEDLALWSESYGGSSGQEVYTMAGGGNMNSVGVFMVPNAAPFRVTGSGAQNLTNAQYIVRSFTVDGGAQLNMAVDPNNAVTLPQLGPFILVR